MVGEFWTVSIVKGIGAVLEVVLQIVVARQLGAEAYGQLAYIISAGALAYYICFGGVPKVLVRYTSIGLDYRAFWKRYIAKYVLPVTLGLVLLSYSFLGMQVVTVALWALGLLFFMASNSILYGYDQATLAAFLEYGLFRALVLAFIGGMIFLGSDIGAWHAVGAYLVSYGIVIVVQYHAVRKLTRDSVGELGNVSRELAVFQGIEVTANAVHVLPRLLQYALVGPVSNAHLSVALHVRNAVMFVAGPTAKVFFRRFVRSKALREEMRKAYTDASRWQAYIGTPVFLFVAANTDVIAGFFGADFVGAAVMIRWVALASLVELLAGPASNFFQMTGRQGIELSNQVAEVGLLIGITLISWTLGGGDLAVVIGMVAASVLMSIIRVWELWVRDGFLPHSKRQVAHILGLSACIWSPTLVLVTTWNFQPLAVSLCVTGALVAMLFALSPVCGDREFIREMWTGATRMLRGKKL